MVLALSAGQTISGEPGVQPSIQDVKAEHENELLARPGVVSVGIGQDADGHLIIVIGLDKDQTETLKALPTELDGYRVKAEVIGPIKAQ